MTEGDHSTGGVWPPPHPSPPLPPPPGYGAPGAKASRAPLIWASVAIGMLAATVLIFVAVMLVPVDGDPATGVGDASGTASPIRQQQFSTPSAGDQTSGSVDPSPEAVSVTCWDGSAAAGIKACGRPTGRAGLEWVFPGLVDQRCSERPALTGADAPTLRLLCLDRLADGSMVQIGYFEWPSVQAGLRFYGGEGLVRQDVTDESGEVVGRLWLSQGGEAKGARMYLREPFSVTVTVAEQGLQEEALSTVATGRPQGEVRGVPTS